MLAAAEKSAASESGEAAQPDADEADAEAQALEGIEAFRSQLAGMQNDIVPVSSPEGDSAEAGAVGAEEVAIANPSPG